LVLLATVEVRDWSSSCQSDSFREAAETNQRQLPHPNVEQHDVRMGHPRDSCWNAGLGSLGAFGLATAQQQK